MCLPEFRAPSISGAESWGTFYIYYLFTHMYLWKHNCVGVGVTSFGDMPGFSDVGSGG